MDERKLGLKRPSAHGILTIKRTQHYKKLMKKLPTMENSPLKPAPQPSFTKIESLKDILHLASNHRRIFFAKFEI